MPSINYSYKLLTFPLQTNKKAQIMRWMKTKGSRVPVGYTPGICENPRLEFVQVSSGKILIFTDIHILVKYKKLYCNKTACIYYKA